MSRPRTQFVLLPLLALESLAVADERDLAPPFQSPDWHVTPRLLVGVEHFHYAEGDQQPAVILDQHTAFLPTAQLAVELTSPRSRFYARASFELESGSMTYDGQNMLGMPVVGPTTGDMTDFEVIAGGRGHIASHVWLGGYIGLGHHTWERDLRPIGIAGYLEQYSWSYLPIGAVLDVAIDKRLTLSLDGSIQVTRQGDLAVSDVHLSATQTADPANVTLATDLGLRLRLSGAYALTRRLHLVATAGIESFQINDGPGTALTVNGQPLTDGNGDPVGISEPFSKTTRYTLGAGASYTF